MHREQNILAVMRLVMRCELELKASGVQSRQSRNFGGAGWQMWRFGQWRPTQDTQELNCATASDNSSTEKQLRHSQTKKT